MPQSLAARSCVRAKRADHGGGGGAAEGLVYRFRNISQMWTITAFCAGKHSTGRGSYGIYRMPFGSIHRAG
eukprot:8538067-Pyramimonas_sp.AAC.1